MPDEEKRGGGSKTPERKERSSQNSTDHGLRSKKFLILADESQDDFDEVDRGWRAQFTPYDYQEDKLVKTLVLNDRLHQRAERRLIEAEGVISEASGTDATRWTAEEPHRIELIQRYKTTAERAILSGLDGSTGDCGRI